MAVSTHGACPDMSTLQWFLNVSICSTKHTPGHSTLQAGKTKDQRCLDWVALHSFLRGQALRTSMLASIGPLDHS